MVLSDRLYVGNFPFVVEHENDDNGHLRNYRYFEYSDRVRDMFLEILGFSDKLLRGQYGVKFVIRPRKADHKLEIFQGDKIDIQLEVALDKTPFLRMDYTFYNSQGEIAFTDKTWNVFVNERTGESIPVPAFFLDALRGKS